MIAVLQRVLRARVVAGDEVVGEIGAGLLVLAASTRGDRDADVDALARKIADYRVFEDAEGKTNRSALDVGAAALVVSQFTLAADGGKGNRPSFDRAAPPDDARRALDRLASALRAAGLRVETGRFGASMRVELVNDGPATYVLERPRPGDPGPAAPRFSGGPSS